MAHRPTDWQEVFGFSDPTPGDPWEIQQVEKTWRKVHEHAASAETTLRGLLGDDAVATWIGVAGDTFRTKSSDLPDQLGKVSESYRQAADAMSWWSGRLDTHQGDADYQLARGREALADLKAAQSKLDLAGHDVDGALQAPGMTALAPTPEQVQHAQDQLKAAQTAQTAAQGLVDNAQARLDAARALAADAGEARRTDGKETASKIRAAADAGVPPRSRWQKIKDGLSDAWDFIVDVAKIVVAVLGVVVLIIGGPLAWIVLAAALIVLVDTLVKFAKGQASLLDVALALVDCIPGTKGITTLARLKTLATEGVSAAKLFGGVGRYAGMLLKEPALALKQFASNPAVRLERMALSIKHMSPIRAVQDAATAFGDARAGGKGLWGSLEAAEAARFSGFRSGYNDMVADIARTDPARAANLWQGGGGYFGVDPLQNTAISPGDLFVTSGPGSSGWIVRMDLPVPPGGVPADAYNQGVQVGANFNFPTPLRGDGYVIQATDTSVIGEGVAINNPQFGAGGFTQGFTPHVDNGLLAHGSNDYFQVVDTFDFTMPASLDMSDIRSLGESNGIREAMWAPLQGTAYVLPAVQEFSGSQP